LSAWRWGLCVFVSWQCGVSMLVCCLVSFRDILFQFCVVLKRRWDVCWASGFCTMWKLSFQMSANFTDRIAKGDQPLPSPLCTSITIDLHFRLSVDLRQCFSWLSPGPTKQIQQSLGKFVPVLNCHLTTKTNGGSGGVAVRSARWKWVVSFRNRQRYGQEKKRLVPVDKQEVLGRTNRLLSFDTIRNV
jgi:hypothetical protein